MLGIKGHKKKGIHGFDILTRNKGPYLTKS